MTIAQIFLLTLVLFGLLVTFLCVLLVALWRRNGELQAWRQKLELRLAEEREPGRRLEEDRLVARAGALREMYRRAARVGYYIERSIISHTRHPAVTSGDLLDQAEEAFEELMRYRWENEIVLDIGEDRRRTITEMMLAVHEIRSNPDHTDSPRDYARKIHEARVAPVLQALRADLDALG